MDQPRRTDPLVRTGAAPARTDGGDTRGQHTHVHRYTDDEMDHATHYGTKHVCARTYVHTSFIIDISAGDNIKTREGVFRTVVKRLIILFLRFCVVLPSVFLSRFKRECNRLSGTPDSQTCFLQK